MAKIPALLNQSNFDTGIGKTKQADRTPAQHNELIYYANTTLTDRTKNLLLSLDISDPLFFPVAQVGAEYDDIFTGSLTLNLIFIKTLEITDRAPSFE